jgi:hypothetical protein
MFLVINAEIGTVLEEEFTRDVIGTFQLKSFILFLGDNGDGHYISFIKYVCRSSAHSDFNFG